MNKFAKFILIVFAAANEVFSMLMPLLVGVLVSVRFGGSVPIMVVAIMASMYRAMRHWIKE